MEGARRAGAAGDGLMLSRTQPRPAETPHLSLPDIQHPMIDAYLEALPLGRAPRILASRTVFVADDREEALRLAEIGLMRQRARYATIGRRVFVEGMSIHDQIAAMDIHIGNPAEVIGGWQVPRPGVKKGRERGSTVLTIQDIERIGIDKTVEIALEVAWKGASAVYLSFDVDSVDAGAGVRGGFLRNGQRQFDHTAGAPPLRATPVSC